ncbi:MAG TPA: retropepsin-like aspartic protease [Polyangia bacterium]|jgi:predicted aspartyl protease
MLLAIRNRLPFATVTVTHAGVAREIAEMLVDTGSATTVLSADVAAELGITPAPSDRIRMLRGIGGHEMVFNRRIDRLQVGERALAQFAIEIAGMDYGFEINGILGMNFLREAGAVLNLRDLTLDYS